MLDNGTDNDIVIVISVIVIIVIVIIVITVMVIKGGGSVGFRNSLTWHESYVMSAFFGAVGIDDKFPRNNRFQ